VKDFKFLIDNIDIRLGKLKTNENRVFFFGLENLMRSFTANQLLS
jgi:hypothetical protein